MKLQISNYPASWTFAKVEIDFFHYYWNTCSGVTLPFAQPQL